MNGLIKDISQKAPAHAVLSALIRKISAQKIDRNDPCPCQSSDSSAGWMAACEEGSLYSAQKEPKQMIQAVMRSYFRLWSSLTTLVISSSESSGPMLLYTAVRRVSGWTPRCLAIEAILGSVGVFWPFSSSLTYP